ncbi:helix-turn-helix domain-containing protein [Runella sp.]|uniref:helix-turn-helix domain-containing protein n=1 Tax=Runella sp. TaxID=1960881 RepID=UPI003D109036
MHIGEQIKKIREARGMTNAEFARLLGMTENNLFSVYRREDTTTDIIKKVMAKTGITAAYFFESGSYPTINQNGNVNSIGENKVTYRTTTTESEGIEVALLKVQLESANKEIEYLKQIIEMMKAAK